MASHSTLADAGTAAPTASWATGAPVLDDDRDPMDHPDTTACPRCGLYPLHGNQPHPCH